MQIPDSLIPIIQKHLAGTASDEEIRRLNDWYHAHNDTLAEIVEPALDEAIIGKRIKDRLPKENVGEVKRMRFPKWLSAAAAVLLLLLSATYLFLSRTNKITVAGIPEINASKQEIKYGGNKATLTLANGSVILLDSVQNGLLGQQGNTKIIKLNSGQLAYNAEQGIDNAPMFNTIATPRGGQYAITLPDNTKVWLNAASSIRFPTAFTGGERNVEITGEAYFEVAKNAAMPFKVHVGETVIQVLGTHFNIMAYQNEAAVNTTLLEGSLKVTNGNASKLIAPGQQASVAENGSISLLNDADTDEAVAWKNGLFQFNSTDIKTIMRQIERWYDVEVVFEKNTSLHLSGQVTRYTNINEVLRKLELTNEIHFTINERKITVH